jgi:hypothetical protein
MAPLSVLPGRVRFESSSLIGSKEGCLLLEDAVSSVQGVTEASASHRTGRVLVLFDEKLVSRGEIEAHLGQALRAVAERKERGDRPVQVRPSAPARGTSSGVGHFVMELALHAFLPAPLDLLLPMAATGLRR